MRRICRLSRLDACCIGSGVHVMPCDINIYIYITNIKTGDSKSGAESKQNQHSWDSYCKPCAFHSFI